MQSRTPQHLFGIAFQHLKASQWKDAEQIYQKILSVEPDNADALQMLGVTAGQMGRHREAVDLIQKAIGRRPYFPTAYYNLANSLRDDGRPDEAIFAYRKAITQNPVYQKAFLNLGILLAGLGRIDQAITIYRQAVAIDPRLPEAHYNLALSLQEKGELDPAIKSYQAAIERRPGYADAYRNMGSAFALLGQLDGAVKAFVQSIQFNPRLIGAYINLSGALRCQRRYEDAAKVCRQAIEIEPESALSYCELGNALKNQGALVQAAQAYRDAIALDADLVTAHLGLSQILENQGDLAGAIELLQTARNRVHDPQSVNYVLAALGNGQTPAKPPAEFVVGLFDEYANHFDSSLAALNYRGPQLLFEAVMATGAKPPLDILDLGCGTGLCGILFRPLARELIGVDLSPRMIEQARQRGGYDQLKQQEITAALQQSAQSFDLIIAADVFIYVGDLQAIFESAANALRPDGLFAFTIECTNDSDFILGSSRRYSQSADYIQRLATARGFKIVSAQDAAIRNENDLPVAGKVFVLSIT